MEKTKRKRQRTYVDVKFKSIFIASSLVVMLEYLMSLTDKILSGNMLGADALAAITLVEPFKLVVAFMSYVFAGIAGAPVAAALGRGDKKKAEQYISQSVILAVIIGIIITFIYTIFTEPLIHSVAGDSSSLPYVRDYFKYLRFIPLPMLLNEVMYLAVLYRGGEKYCNISAGVSLVFNIGLSVLLCFKMGIAGIGLGTLVGLIAGLIPLLSFMFTRNGKIHFYFRLSLKDIKNAIIYSVANSLVYLYLAVFEMAMNAYLVANYDDIAIILFTGVINVVSMVSSMSDGLVEFIVPMLNIYRGEGNVVGCKKTIDKALKASVIEGAIVSVVLLVFTKLLAIILGVNDPAVSNKFMIAIRIYAVTITLYYVTDMYTQYYLYIDKFKETFIMGLLKGLVVPLGLGVTGGIAFGINGVWIGMSISQIVMAAVILLIAKFNPKAGKRALFLDEKQLSRQWLWNVNMNEHDIMNLIDSVRDVMESHGIDKRRINKAALAIEESQLASTDKKEVSAHDILECTLILDEENDNVKLILRNTAEGRNVLEEKTDGSIEEQMSSNIINHMHIKGRSYILVNGNNRLIFEL